MIRFEGIQSTRYQAAFHRQQRIRLGLLSLSIILPLVVLMLVLFLVDDISSTDHVEMWWIISLALLAPCLLFLPFVRGMRLPMTGQILVIENDSVWFCSYQLQYASRVKLKARKISHVRKVVDYGDWYFLYFRMNPITMIGCQKDHLLLGSIEEFEKMFQDKLVQKHKE